MDYFTAQLLLAAGFLSLATTSQFETECYTANGEDYRGRQNQTHHDGGLPCLYWNETLQHPYNTLKFPKGEKGLGSHNYCRNPDGDVSPWCYVADHEDGIYWKYCYIPSCQMPGNLGCFKDSGDPPTLIGPSETSNKLTIQSCISYCRAQRYKLAGMEAGYACFCGNNLDYHLHGETSSTDCSHVCFGDHTQPCGGDGRIIIYDSRIGSCGGNYTSPSEVLYSPDFPARYGPGRVCYWTIQVQDASMLLFNFALFDLPDQADMVELLDGHTNQVVARFDGRYPPQGTVNISSDFAILYFYSDRTNQGRGFAVKYQALATPELIPVDHKDADEEEEGASAADPETESDSLDPDAVTERYSGNPDNRSSQVFYVITSTPSEQDPNIAAWTVYVLAALLTVVILATVTRLLLHIIVRSSVYPAITGPGAGSPNKPADPWIILYQPSTISFFKKKLKNHQPDLSPLVGH